jgi:hypothetical protein
MTGGEHGANVIRQRQKRAHRNVQALVCGRSGFVQTGIQIRRRTPDCTFSPVRQLHNDQTGTASRTATTDGQATAIQRVMRINDPDLSDSPVNICGIMR